MPPAALGIASYDCVTPDNFPRLVAQYPGAALELPPPAHRSVSGWAQSGEPLTLTLPEGYVADAAEVRYVILPEKGLPPGSRVSSGRPGST